MAADSTNDTEDTLCPNCGRKPLFSCREGFCKGAPSLEQTKATLPAVSDEMVLRAMRAHNAYWDDDKNFPEGHARDSRHGRLAMRAALEAALNG